MAKVLNDIELTRLLGTAIVDGDESSIRPNSYILRLGAQGEFLNTGKEIDQQFKTVTQEYADIDDAIRKQSTEIKGIRETQGNTPDTVRQILRDEAGALQNRWLIGVSSIFVSIAGLFVASLSSEAVLAVLREYGPLIGLGLVVIGAGTLAIISRRK